jgi:carbon monoxide dehydrogenase subunit G
MTKEQLDAIRLEYISDPCHHPIPALLDEVERLTTLLAGTEAVLENEREYQTRLKAEVGQLANESFRRGAEAMRESAAQQCEVSPVHGEKTTTARKYADAVRALPTPEDK